MIQTNFRGAMGHALDSFLYRALLDGLTRENLARLVQEALAKHVDGAVIWLLKKLNEDLGYDKTSYNMDRVLYNIVVRDVLPDLKDLVEESVKSHLKLTDPQRKRLRTIMHKQIADSVAGSVAAEADRIARDEGSRIYQAEFASTIVQSIQHRLREMGMEVPTSTEPTKESVK